MDSKPTRQMVITIDGPAAAGKSTVAKLLAKRLGFGYLDTGGMYRAVALAGSRRGVSWDDEAQVLDLCRTLNLRVKGDRIFLDNEDVTELIRYPEVTRQTGFAADSPIVRKHLIQQQRAIAAGNSIVTEGRDQGTVVFPDADYKFFLVASPEERARRRCLDYARQGKAFDFGSVLQEILERDTRDRQRPFGALVGAEDAIEIATDGLTPEQVVDKILAYVQGGESRTILLHDQ